MRKNKRTATPTRPKVMGRTPYQPTDVNRGEVRVLATIGYTQEQIASYLGIAKMTLTKHFRAELDRAAMAVLAQCVTNVIMLANGRPAEYDARGNLIRTEIPVSLGANAFLLKTKGKFLGWNQWR
jgi:hypothetical protein